MAHIIKAKPLVFHFFLPYTSFAVKFYAKIVFIFLIFIITIFASWYVIHGDIHINTDIARDFLLFQEISQKKVILIGPRSSAGGLFHGPLWLYLNYSAYLLGYGNPVVIGWFWVLLFLSFLTTSFFVAKKLFNNTTAYFYVAMLSVFLAQDIKELFNPHGALFLLPLFFFFFIRYLQKTKAWYLALFFLILGCIIQFQMAIGIPLLILSSFPLVYTIIKKRKYKHFLAFGVLLASVSNFILFDIRHQFLLLNSVIHNLSPAGGEAKYSYGFLVLDRLQMLTSLQLIREATFIPNILTFCVTAVFIFFQIKNKKYKTIYFSFLYFYIGYLFLTLLSKHMVLTHQFFPLYSLIILIFASFVTSKYKMIFTAIFLLVFIKNFSYNLSAVKGFSGFTGKSQESWKFLSEMSKNLCQTKDKDFGYFVYAPDILAYQSKYAVWYTCRLSQVNALSFRKKAVTYVVAAPPPSNNPDMKDEWWRINEIKIVKDPIQRKTFPNGYKIEKYILTPEEISVLPNPDADTGLHFR